MNGPVSGFAKGSALLVFGLYLALLLGVSVARPLMAAYLGPLTAGNWLMLALHLTPVLLGIEHLRRERRQS